MLKLLKYLKKSIFAIILIAILLVIQANTDLALPSYTSDIVNVGILNGGIDSYIPDVIRAKELNNLSLFLSTQKQDMILTHYTLLEYDELSTKDQEKYSEMYPLLTSEPLYVWDGTGSEILLETLSFPMFLLLGMENESEQTELMKSGLIAQLPTDLDTTGLNFADLLSLLPEEPRLVVVNQLTEQLASVPDMLLSSSAITYVKAEYSAIGIKVDKLQTNYILNAGLKMLGLALIGSIASIIVSFIGSIIAARMGRDLRKNVFKKVLSFSNAEMDHFSTASLITRSTNDIQQVQTLIVMVIRIVIYAPILAIGGILKVLQTNTSMAWILAVGVGTITFFILTLLIVALPKFKIMQKLVDRINLVMREILTGLPVIRAFSNERYEKDRFDNANKDLMKNSLFINRVMAIMMPVLTLIMNLVMLLILWVGADKINVGTMQVGDLFAFISYTMQIIMSFLMFTMVSIALPRAAVAANRIDEILSSKNTINDPYQEENLSINNKGLLEFRNVSFRYPNAEEDVLKNIDFTAKPGETTAIIGSTGSGKSTLINLIPRFYDVTEGEILINGVDIRKIKQRSLRSKLGFIPQKGVLFSGTIESNIKFSNPNSNDDVMIKAARIAQATEFIDDKSEGYKSEISQGGTNVSGGQKQRLAIARAIAKDPDIYVFDDSFSALDYKTDAILRQTLKKELADRTLLIVAQRISTIRDANQILVLDDGVVVGKGSHKDLLRDCEVYRQIASSQLSKEELDHE